MTRTRSRSIWIPCLNPFIPDGGLDEDALRAHMRRFADVNASVFVANEGTGESFAMPDSEVRRVLEIAGEELLGKVPVRAMGRMARTAREQLEFVRMVKEVGGTDGIHIYTLDMGHGFRPSRREVDQYLNTVLGGIDMPITLSLSFVLGWEYPVDLVAEMIERFPNITGLIVTSESELYLDEVISAVGEQVEIHTVTWLAMTNLALGGDGFAGPEAVIAPKLSMKLMNDYAAGDYASAEDAFSRLMKLTRLNRRFGTAGVKAAVRYLGHEAGDVREPRLSLHPEEVAIVEKIIDDAGIAVFEK
jgi:4-hydroxy-tetrahydrodipicolinate synthase